MTNTSGSYPLPYPESTDPVNVHGDIRDLASSVSTTLQALNLSVIQVNVKNTSGSTLNAGWPVYATGESNGIVTIDKALPETTKPVLGLLRTTLTNNQSGIVVVAGVMTGINTSNTDWGVAGDILYVGATGGLSTTTSGAAVGILAVKHSTNGAIIVEAKGNGTWGALKAGLA
jgi:hypothetical protein